MPVESKLDKRSESDSLFLLKFTFWLIVLFGLFYWGKYWSYSPLGEWIDTIIRATIMPLLDAFINLPIKGYDIIVNPRFHIVITPECNGLVPYLMLLSAILAYRSTFSRKAMFAIITFIVIYLVNILRLYFVVYIVEEYGTDKFYLAHDIAGNILLIATSAILYLKYLDGYYEEKIN